MLSGYTHPIVGDANKLSGTCHDGQRKPKKRRGLAADGQNLRLSGARYRRASSRPSHGVLRSEKALYQNLVAP
jgi:hypothetical protein